MNEPSHAFVLFELSKLHSNNLIFLGNIEVDVDIVEVESLADEYKVEVEIGVSFDDICSINFVVFVVVGHGL